MIGGDNTLGIDMASLQECGSKYGHLNYVYLRKLKQECIPYILTSTIEP